MTCIDIDEAHATPSCRPKDTARRFGCDEQSDVQPKMLYIIGLGLADEKDISVRGLEIVRKAERVYLEAYTAVLLVDKDVLVREYSLEPPYIEYLAT